MTPWPLSSPPRWLRWAALVIGGALFLWLPFEDTSVDNAIVFAILICGWWAVRYLLPIPASSQKKLPRQIAVASLAGLFVSPVAVLLMAIKTGLHGHPSPDFTPEQLRAVLISTPAWILAGFLLGLGSGLWQSYRNAENA